MQKDDVGRVATIEEADLALHEDVPACAEGVVGSTRGATSIIHITNRVLLKRVFLTPDQEPE